VDTAILVKVSSTKVMLVSDIQKIGDKRDHSNIVKKKWWVTPKMPYHQEGKYSFKIQNVKIFTLVRIILTPAFK
jgi:hypothetical protein